MRSGQQTSLGLRHPGQCVRQRLVGNCNNSTGAEALGLGRFRITRCAGSAVCDDDVEDDGTPVDANQLLNNLVGVNNTSE